MSGAKSALRNIPIGVVPAVAYLIVLCIVPFVLLAYYSLLTFKQGAIVAGPSFAGYAKLLSDPYVYFLFWRTIYISAGVTGLCLLFGYPTAYLFMKVRSPLWKIAILVAISAPLLTSGPVRTYAWYVILGKQGLAYDLLSALGVTQQPTQMLFTEPAVWLAMVQILLPLMIVPLISTLRSLPRDVEDAATNLRATRWRTFWEIILPQTISGIAAGVTLVFTISFTMFTIPLLMGGGSFRIVSTYIWTNVNMLTWDTASQYAALLLVTSLVIVTAITQLARRMTAWQHPPA